MDLNIIWDKMSYIDFICFLKSIGEEEYKKFNKRIIFTKYDMIGIRLPRLRSIAKKISKGDYNSFLKVSKNHYYEEVMIRLLVISNIKDIDEVMLYFYEGVKLIDNWALCDTFCNSLKIIKKDKKYFLKVIDTLINNKETYHVRVGIVLLIFYYVEEHYLDLIFNYLDEIKSNEYYINMAEAWLICEVFINYEKECLVYLENNHLNKFTINKAISKIRDSYKVSKEMKDFVLKYKK